MLKIIDFKYTTNHCVLTYEWNDPKEYIQTASVVFDTKQKAYKYWGVCCRDYLKQQVDKINKVYSHINQELPQWVKDFWMLSDKKMIEIDFQKLILNTGDKTLVDDFIQLKDNCTKTIKAFKELQNT